MTNDEEFVPGGNRLPATRRDWIFRLALAGSLVYIVGVIAIVVIAGIILVHAVT